MSIKQVQLIQFIREKGGFVEYSELIKSGFNKLLIREALNSGQIERISRGIYSLSEIPDVSHPDLIAVSFVIPNGVICLISALSFYEVTDEIPHCTYIAIPAQSRAKKIQGFPIRYYRFSQKTWEAGIEEDKIDNYKIRVYSLAKTIADCFKFRNQIGTNIARSALKTAIEQKKVSHLEVMKYAYICRVNKVIKPILETLI